MENITRVTGFHALFLEGGPLLVVSRVITALVEVITPCTHF